MRSTLVIAAVVSAALAVPTAGLAQAAQPEDLVRKGAAKQSYIVVLRDDVTAHPREVAREQRRMYHTGASLRHVYTSALTGYSARMNPAAARRLRTDPDVLFVQKDGVVRATARRPAPTPPAQSLPTGVNRVDADLSPTAKIDKVDVRVNVDVAVIDTGIDLDHPDLNVYAAGAKNCSTARSVDDDNGHGTHVAGTIGAKDNTIGVVGVAPGARVWPVRVLDRRGSGAWSAIICGIDYVAANAATIEVANMSLGGAGVDSTCTTDALHLAVCNAVAKGVVFVAAAGNSATDANTFVPATYAELITVSALADFNGEPNGGAASTCMVDVDDTFASYSNFGADVDLIAPGTCISSTTKGGGYAVMSGTSMASPHVAGGAALYAATHPAATPADVKAALQQAGTLAWNAVDDRDGIKERLLNVSTY